MIEVEARVRARSGPRRPIRRGPVADQALAGQLGSHQPNVVGAQRQPLLDVAVKQKPARQRIDPPRNAAAGRMDLPDGLTA
jgi:hypothetical protein